MISCLSFAIRLVPFRRMRLLLPGCLAVISLSVTLQAQPAGPFQPVHEYLQQAVEDDLVAGGAVLVYHQGQTVFQTGFGHADRDSGRPFETATPAIIASISKPMLGTTLYRLVESGQLDPGRPVSGYLPLFLESRLESGEPLVRAPTLTELLTHTSGLRSDYDEAGRIWFQRWTRNGKLEDVVNRIATDIPFKRSPGERRAYSGIGTEVAARVGELVSGLPRNEMLQQHLCQPLGLTATFYRDKAGLEELNRTGSEMPTRYVRSKESGKLVAMSRRFVPDTHRYSSSGGTIVSTTADLLTWLLMIRNQGAHGDQVFLQPETVAELIRPHPVGNFAQGGLAVRETDEAGRPVVLGHTGSSGTAVFIDLRNDIISIVLTQTEARSDRGFRKELESRIRQAIKDRQLTERSGETKKRSGETNRSR